MLELRPTCEHCNKALPPDSLEARICTYECTFCATCVEEILENVCPNCGGGFEARPVRPTRSWRETTGLAVDPPGTRRRHTPRRTCTRTCRSARPVRRGAGPCRTARSSGGARAS